MPQHGLNLSRRGKIKSEELTYNNTKLIILKIECTFKEGFKNTSIKKDKTKLTLTKTKTHVKIPRADWEKMKKNPALSEAIELLEDIADLKEAKKVRGKSLSVEQYVKKRGL